MSTASAQYDQTAGQYISDFELLKPQLPGKDLPWLHTVRQTGLEAFSRLGFPTPKQENWKYTNLKPITKHSFQQSFKTCVGLDIDDLGEAALPGLDAYRLVFVNGQYARLLSKTSKPITGLSISSMAQALEANADFVQQHLAKIGHSKDNGFLALNQSLFSDGAAIHIAKNTYVDKPIHLVFVSTVMRDPTWHQLRNLIVAEANSQATIIESYLPLEDSVYLNNSNTEITLADNAQLEHYKLQQESDQGFHISTLDVNQDRDSRFNSHSLAFGSRIARNDINIGLNAKGAECSLNGLYLGTGRQHIDFHTRVDHRQPHGTSKENYKGILAGRSRAVFNGQVYVHPHAQKTDAQQSNKNLLLSEHAEIDTKPQLEIYADDVKCAHGATVGQLDEQMLFYLRSRGLSEATARGMLTYGFASDLVEQLKIPEIRERISHLLLERLPDSDVIKDIV